MLHGGVGRLLRLRRVDELALGRGHRVAVAIAFFFASSRARETVSEQSKQQTDGGGFRSVRQGRERDRGVQAGCLLHSRRVVI